MYNTNLYLQNSGWHMKQIHWDKPEFSNMRNTMRWTIVLWWILAPQHNLNKHANNTKCTGFCQHLPNVHKELCIIGQGRSKVFKTGALLRQCYQMHCPTLCYQIMANNDFFLRGGGQNKRNSIRSFFYN